MYQFVRLSKLRKSIQAALDDSLLSSSEKKRRAIEGYVSHVDGHCYVAAEVAYHVLGKPWQPKVISKKVIGSTTHWYLFNTQTNEIFDPTEEQFGDSVIPYHQGKSCGFLTTQPSKRAKIVLERIKSKLH